MLMKPSKLQEEEQRWRDQFWKDYDLALTGLLSKWKGDVVQMSNNDNKFLQRHFPVSNGALQKFMKN